MTTPHLYIKALHIRQSIITMLEEAGSGHSAGPLGMADIYAALYFKVLKHDPKRPDWDERDRVVLSCGHTCPVLYATLGEAGYFPRKELLTLRKLGSRLQGHPHQLALPGVENSSGPLGQGLSQAIGMALAMRLEGKKNRVFCIGSDGEHQEGQWWEAVMFAAHRKLNNLVVVVDRNYIQIDGPTEDIMALEPLKEKYEAFNWHVIPVDGHNIEAFVDACKMAETINDRPVCILAHTIPGKGVSFMENDYLWHGQPPNEEQAAIALKELRSLAGKITSEYE